MSAVVYYSDNGEEILPLNDKTHKKTELGEDKKQELFEALKELEVQAVANGLDSEGHRELRLMLKEYRFKLPVPFVIQFQKLKPLLELLRSNECVILFA